MTRSPAESQRFALHRKGAFSLFELLIAVGISGILLSAAMTAFVFFTKTGLAMGDYYEMENQTRFLLERFARDVREADNADWVNQNKVILSIEDVSVTYEYVPQADTFTRSSSEDAAGTPARVLASGVVDADFVAYDQDGGLVAILLDPVLGLTKMIQLSLELQRPNNAGGNPTSFEIVSSRYLLRNKSIPAP